jgi:hypothetical protein
VEQPKFAVPRGAYLSLADLREANLREANLREADLHEANIGDANVSSVRWDRAQMRHRYGGIRGIDSCYGNALFKRDAADQDYLDTLEASWSGSGWRSFLFRVWGRIDYGRSLLKVFGVALTLIVFFGTVYCVWPELLGSTMTGKDKEYDFFTPFYFSVRTLRRIRPSVSRERDA